jgi:ankyrin repeat protein
LHTALAAQVGNHIETVEYLLSLPKTLINATDRWHKSAYQMAKDGGFHELATLLRQKGALAMNPDMGYSMCVAAFKNDRAALDKLLDNGVDVNVADYDCRTALHLAASEGHASLVRFLLGVGALPFPQDRFGNTPYDDAVRHSHPDIAKLLQTKYPLEYQANLAAHDGAPASSNVGLRQRKPAKDADERQENDVALAVSGGSLPVMTARGLN